MKKKRKQRIAQNTKWGGGGGGGWSFNKHMFLGEQKYICQVYSLKFSIDM